MKLDTGKTIKTANGYIQYFEPEEINGGKGLPEDLIKAFVGTGDAQRSNKGCPETIMRNGVRYIGGGVLCHLLEHVGDLTHRLTHHIEFGSVYEDLVENKVTSAVRTLSRGQGFIDEHESNVINNAEYKGVPVSQFRNEMAEFLENYVNAHEKVPVYNRIQWYAREAAIQIGSCDFDAALHALTILDNELKNKHTFLLRATMINRDHDGNVAEFEKEDLGLALDKAQDIEMNKVM